MKKYLFLMLLISPIYSFASTVLVVTSIAGVLAGVLAGVDTGVGVCMERNGKQGANVITGLDVCIELHRNQGVNNESMSRGRTEASLAEYYNRIATARLNKKASRQNKYLPRSNESANDHRNRYK